MSRNYHTHTWSYNVWHREWSCDCGAKVEELLDVLGKTVIPFRRPT